MGGRRWGAIDALVNVGDVADRDVIYQLAQAGELSRSVHQRNGHRFIRQHGAYAFALLSQPGDLARYDELIAGTENAQLLESLNVYRPMVEQVAEACANDRGADPTQPYQSYGCLTGLLSNDDNWIAQKAAFDLAHFAANPTAAAGVLLGSLESIPLARRYDFVRQLHNLPMPQTAGEQVQTMLENASGNTTLRDFRHVLRVLREARIN